MKTKLQLIVICLSLLFSSKLSAGVDDLCGTTSGITAPSIPLSGNIKIFIVFAQFKDDPDTNDNGWPRNSYPAWANNFINAEPNSTYPWNNLSHYYNEMSNGTFQIIGDVYNSLVTTDYNENHYSSIGEVNREIIMEVDPYVNFGEYDNLNESAFGSDGKVDFILIIYRKTSIFSYSGIAHLEVSATIKVDGKQIVNYSGLNIGGGVQQKGGINGRDYTLYVAAHEIGHYLFGASHIDYVSNLALMSGKPVWNASRAMHSWERQRVGWINYIDKSTDGLGYITDFITTDKVYRVPINSTEYFLVENRRKLSTHDKAGDIGFYIYRVTGAASFPPTIDVLCADGNWNFSINTSTQSLIQTTPNVNGKDEMNFSQTVGGIVYACRTPFYHENSAWGDDEDAFDLTFNNVLSPVSNPRSTNSSSINFTIEIVGTNYIYFYFAEPYLGNPSKPQNLQVTENSSHNPLLTWDINGEDDIFKYIIDRAEGSGDGVIWENNIAQTSINWFVDYDVAINPVFEDEISYRIRALDTQGKISVPSTAVSIDDAVLHKRQNLESKEYSNVLDLAYPNPFNPVTTLSYSIKKTGFVQLKIYNFLGQEIITLVNELQSEGKYSVNFDASKLVSGVYIYSLRVNDFMQNKKMTLLK